MIATMRPDATLKEIADTVRAIEAFGARTIITRLEERTLIGIISKGAKIPVDLIREMQGIESVETSDEPFQLVSRQFHPRNTIIRIGKSKVGDGGLAIIAGPCSVESKDQILTTARYCAVAEVTLLRGGAFKPRSSPYSFQGLGEEGLRLLAEAGKDVGLPVITEVLTPETVELTTEYADVLQIGARSMQNFKLLEAVGQCGRPVLLKRGMHATIEEFLLAAEYIYTYGNKEIILCERGIRTFERYTRNTLDISAVPVLKQLSHLPVFVDPSHAAGRRELILPLSKAAIAAGADGLMIETHPDPDEALSDGSQSLPPEQFSEAIGDIRRFFQAVCGNEK